MAEITVASTTDTQEDVDAVAGVVTETENEPEQSEPESEQVEAEAEPEQGEAAVEAEGEQEEVEPPQQRRNGWQKRVDKLTARNYALEEELEQQRSERKSLEDRLSRLESSAGKTAAAETQASGFQKPKPNQKDFDDYDKFVDALTDWKLEEKEFKAVQAKNAETQNKIAERQKETFASYNKAVSEARAQFDDWDEVINREDLTLPLAVQAAIIGMGKDGPAVSYAIARDEEMCEYLSSVAVQQGDMAALTEFGRWLGRAEEPTDKGPARKTAAAPPKPIRPVGNSSTKSSVPIDELDYQDYRRIRAEQERARYRR